MTADPEEVVRRSLRRVLDPVVVEHLRDDTPVLGGSAGSGLGPADAIALADAVQQAAADVGAECLLQDEDLDTETGPVTLGHLVAAVSRRWRQGP